MRYRSLISFLCVLTSAGIVHAAEGTGDIGRLPSAVSAIQPGQWTIESKGHAPKSLCISDARFLLQIEHGPANCSRLTVEDKPGRAIVQYSCPGAGWGRTTLFVESASLVHIDTQGIAANAPFSYTADAHRSGACAIRP